MVLSNTFAWALEGYSCSGIKVYCNQEEAKAIADTFINEFSTLWEEALQSVKSLYKNVEDQEVPTTIELKDYGFFIGVSQLEIEYAYGDYYDPDHGNQAFNKALDHMNKTYPNLKYEGYITYPLCDMKAGEIFVCEIGANQSNKTYDFVGEAMNQMLNSDDVEEVFASQLESELDFEETIQSLLAYKEYIDEDVFESTMQMILAVAEENDEDVDALNELLETLNEEE